MTHLWLVRHGPTHAKTMVGWTDLPADLSDEPALARLNAYLPPAPVISSDLARAVTTADALCHSRKRLPHDTGLRELHFGAWENRSFADAEADDPAHICAFWERPGPVTAPQGESWDDLAARVTAVIDRHLRLASPALIVVCHFGPILTQVQRALGISTTEAFAHRIENLSVTDLRCDGGQWRAGQINHRP